MQKQKYDIEFPNPFWLGLEILEIDDKLPSFGGNASLRFKFPRGEFEYRASDIWFECSVFDDFEKKLKELYAGKDVEAKFFDIDREIVYSFNKNKIEASVQRIHSEKGSGYMEFKCDFDPELVALQLESIGNFAKWW